MRSVVVVLLGLLVASVGAGSAVAQAWLTVADAEGRFRLEMPAPFDMPPLQVAPDGTATFSYVHETPELALRFEVIDGLVDGLADGLADGSADHGEIAPTALPTLVSQARDGERMVQMHSRVVGRRIYRVVAIFPPALEGDATILRFMQSVRYYDGPS
jgi:hypothetical protein